MYKIRVILVVESCSLPSLICSTQSTNNIINENKPEFCSYHNIYKIGNKPCLHKSSFYKTTRHNSCVSVWDRVYAPLYYCTTYIVQVWLPIQVRDPSTKYHMMHDAPHCFHTKASYTYFSRSH